MSSGYPSGLTVGAIEMLLHYFYTPVDVDGAADLNHNNYRSIKELEAAELIQVNSGRFKEIYGTWEVTERGKVMARAIMETPLPVMQWQMPAARTGGSHG